MGKTNRARYTLEFKLEAVRLIGAGQSIAATAAILGLPDQTLHNWLKVHPEGRSGRPGDRPMMPGQMELVRFRAELTNGLDLIERESLTKLVVAAGADFLLFSKNRYGPDAAVSVDSAYLTRIA